MEEKTCSKCGGLMKLGTLASNMSVSWFEGDLNNNPLFGKVERKTVISYACDKCGYVESYLQNK